MDLANRDKAIQKIVIELENKRQLLKNKYKSLHNAAADNELLKDVLEDYLTYYDTIKNEKIQQYNALNKTLEHIDSISVDPNSDESMLYNSKVDYKEISHEMDRIKNDIAKME